MHNKEINKLLEIISSKAGDFVEKDKSMREKALKLIDSISEDLAQICYELYGDAGTWSSWEDEGRLICAIDGTDLKFFYDDDVQFVRYDWNNYIHNDEEYQLNEIESADLFWYLIEKICDFAEDLIDNYEG